MILFHGTFSHKGEAIVADRVIKRTDDEHANYDECSEILQTTRGYVYLSNSANKAMEYGCTAYASELLKTEKKDIGFDLYLFKVSITDYSVLENDIDEMKDDVKLHENTMLSLNVTGTVRCSKDLLVNKDILSYTILKFDSFRNAIECIDDIEVLNLNWLEWGDDYDI